MKIDRKSREMVNAIERNGGRASTTVIRQETGLENSSVRYRYDKLESMGLIETERDPSRTPEGVAPVTIASLTDKAYEEIQKGLTVEVSQERAEITPADNADRLNDVTDAFDVLYAHLDVYRQYLAKCKDAPSEERMIEEARERYQTRYDS